MKEAVDTNLINHYMNTFDMVKYNSLSDKMQLLPRIIYCNYTLPPINIILDSENFNIEKEIISLIFLPISMAISMASMAMSTDLILKKFDIYDLMMEYIDRNLQESEKCIKIIDKIWLDPRIDQLVFFIVIDCSDSVIELLKTIDPRNDNYLAYHKAIKINNCVVIQCIIDCIILRNFLEYNVFETQIGCINITKDLYSYFRYNYRYN